MCVRAGICRLLTVSVDLWVPIREPRSVIVCVYMYVYRGGHEEHFLVKLPSLVWVLLLFLAFCFYFVFVCLFLFF